ncbi:MAG: universal stress protein [Bacteroidales bacterium]|nr:universal stress protein [Bacteroidales bacterium]
MEQEKNIILVTWDFSEKSECALEHAILAAKRIKHDIGLVHIVKKDSEAKSAEERIRGAISEKFSQLEQKPQIIIRHGNIFSTITDLANELGAKLVFMGTHGIKGMQKFLGSWALKVIAHTKVPFIVVQEKPSRDTYKNIVIPITFRKENKECINWVNYFSRFFGSHFHIFKAKHSDPNFVKGLDSNIFFLNKFFTSKGISFEIAEAPSESNFVLEAVKYAAKIEADAILIMVTKDIGFADYVLGAHEQYIIANEARLPVICINPKPPKLGGSFSASGG